MAIIISSYEILKDLPDVDVVLVPVGGGGLIGGIAAYLKNAKPSTQVGVCSLYSLSLQGHVLLSHILALSRI